MRRREFLKSAAAGSVAVEHLRSASAERPNFLFLIADDLTFRAIHTLNNPEVRTPHMDILAKRGCAFTHCFHQGSWQPAVCVASRTMLNTGLTGVPGAKAGREDATLGRHTRRRELRYMFHRQVA
jgi:hypothetical protein